MTGVPTVSSAAVPGASRVMPAAARLLALRGLVAADVRATGPGGRLLKEDVLRHRGGAPPASVSAAPGGLLAHVAISLEAVRGVEAAYGDRFRMRHGAALGWLPFVARAVAAALRRAVSPGLGGGTGADAWRDSIDLDVFTATGTAVRLAGVDRLSLGEIARALSSKPAGLPPAAPASGAVALEEGLDAPAAAARLAREPERGAVFGVRAAPDRAEVEASLACDPRVAGPGGAEAVLARVRAAIENPDRLALGL